ncbi:hypothetical protein [Blastococcus sp. TF02A-35]|uniref:hypothetical protein n=1 Tax=Blastococcus sp. TF02A-35 TaxID=2559612 RepID=UPI0010744DE5|nr:hypothetical protein [Blastococcus sp. TF02A_35]TFV53688.1 hypothetical protein E4P43_00055 [Blastococcus sp. TF02A_35]
MSDARARLGLVGEIAWLVLSTALLVAAIAGPLREESTWAVAFGLLLVVNTVVVGRRVRDRARAMSAGS